MKPKRYPPLPKVICAPGGDVTIVQLPKVKHPDGAECWGLWDDSLRTVTIDATATPAHRHWTLYHEMTHVALSDSGLDEGINAHLVEAICNCVATARMRERFG